LVPVEFLSDEQADAYGQFVGDPPQGDLDRFFFLDDVDRGLINRWRGDHNRLGFAVQLCTVRYVGAFLGDPVAVPAVVVGYLAAQLSISDGWAVLGFYRDRPKTAIEHAWEITERCHYRLFTAVGVRDDLMVFVRARAWTQSERPSELFDRAVAWLRRERVLLPGVSIVARLVAEVRSGEIDRLHMVLEGRAAPELAIRLDGLLAVEAQCRSSKLDRLRRAPTRASGPQVVAALDRVVELRDVGVHAVDTADVPAARVASLARQGLTANVTMLRRMPRSRRLATIAATIKALHINAMDDALDVFAVLMATKIIGVSERVSVKEQLDTLPQLTKASRVLADTVSILLAGPDGSEPPGWPQLWATITETVRVKDFGTIGLVGPFGGGFDFGGS
jgi:hypothetical protein